MSISEEDSKILRVLQEEGRISNADLSARVGMSASPCWRRVRKLEQEGVIRNYAARLDRRALGLDVYAYISVQIEDHSEDITARFEKAALSIPEIIACHQVTGSADYMLVVASSDLDSFAQLANNKLRRLPGIKSINSSFVLNDAKPYAGLPV
ncbi:Lrp/AsnC family transcriptional regulator [Sphingorhabdus sp. Alg239-R122]|uniref:Lrp/AsnC family transcriptional regulator n=1 Tax=Sphingorhabdus sp. Alg239-R122 TaxID=2305989 RepID=UPI0013DA9EAB|nr:Lrp/AsnC family transcriptional regulator [Sphingorhabdus sp. Alg239-R122]